MFSRVLTTSMVAFALVLPVASATPDLRSPALSRIASRYVPGTSVYVHRFGDMSAGEASRPGTIQLAPDVVRALRLAPQVITPRYPRSSSGAAVFVFTHEIGHLSGMDAGQWEEARADCYAAAHWRGIARAVGFKAGQFATLARQIDAGVGGGECWGPSGL